MPGLSVCLCVCLCERIFSQSLFIFSIFRERKSQKACWFPILLFLGVLCSRTVPSLPFPPLSPFSFPSLISIFFLPFSSFIPLSIFLSPPFLPHSFPDTLGYICPHRRGILETNYRKSLLTLPPIPSDYFPLDKKKKGRMMKQSRSATSAEIQRVCE